jgi:hypothetical protein
MYTPEEKKAILELEQSGLATRYETVIKELGGGFLITHQISYVDGDEVKGVLREQTVCSDHYAVTRAIAGLYGDMIEELASAQSHQVTLDELDRYTSKKPLYTGTFEQEQFSTEKPIDHYTNAPDN